MASPMKDVVVLIPGITGSVLQKDKEDIWALSFGAAARAALSLGGSIRSLRLEGDDPEADELGDGVTADRVMPDIQVIPGLWRIDGYGKIANRLIDSFDVRPRENFFEFPYDWRRDNRVAARKLARQSHDWLRSWRERSGSDDAKLILIGHSMGGLVAHHFLEMLDGWKDTRMLVTLGTPYRGSLNALEFLAKGLKKKFGPITLFNLTQLVRSFTSVYQLLPIYPCLDPGDGNLLRVTEVDDIRGVDPVKAASAHSFHQDIIDGISAHEQESAYVDGRHGTQPLVGLFQPTSQSALLRDGEIEILRTYEGEDLGGDGTVPSVSATPFHLSNKNLEVYIKDRHASLQNSDHSLDQLVGMLSQTRIDKTRFFAPGAGLSLDLDDAYLPTEPVDVRVLPEVEWAELTATVRSGENDAEVESAALKVAADGWHETALGPFAPGSYRVTVSGQAKIDPVTDVFAVLEEGTDMPE